MIKVNENGRHEVESQKPMELVLMAVIEGDGVSISEKLPENAVLALPEPEPVKAKKSKGAKPKTEKPLEEPASEPAPVEAPKAKPRKFRKPTNGATLSQLKEAYVLSLIEDGKSGGTIASYAAEMDLALGILGAETKLAELTPKQVQRYFDHERVTKLRSGKEKSQLSIDKTRRVFRQALEFAAENNWIEQAPLPESAKETKSKGKAK